MIDAIKHNNVDPRVPKYQYQRNEIQAYIGFPATTEDRVLAEYVLRSECRQA
jgi:hypothetical protein